MFSILYNFNIIYFIFYSILSYIIITLCMHNFNFEKAQKQRYFTIFKLVFTLLFILLIVFEPSKIVLRLTYLMYSYI